VPDDWYVLARSRDLKKGPLAVTLLGTPMVLFRGDDGRAGALLDRCPHRNVPLSLGHVRGATLECAYHGWRFDCEGECRAVPGLAGEAPEHKGRRAPSFATREQDGFVWVWGLPDETPAREPFKFPFLGERGYTSAREVVEASASVHSVAENGLDVPHTAFLHAGLFRKADRPRTEIDVVVRRWHDRVEAEYVGEKRPTGLVGRILAPRGGIVQHWDRFFLPGIVQVEYRLGPSHFCVSAALTPVSDFFTRLFAVISFKLPLPGWLLLPFLRPLAMRIFRQDAVVLARQRETIERFGGEQYTSTDLDVLGPHILRLLRSAERGERAPVEAPTEKSLKMLV
jgi:phenylpropionate dioxygenase-like ring-hydroxylating dioxygenase large terminal subunit